MKSLVAATALALLAAAPAMAQDEARAMIGLGGGMTVPVGDFGDVADPSFSIAAFLSGPLSGAFGWRLEGSYDHFRPQSDSVLEALCDANDIDCDERVWHFGGGLQLTAGGGGSVQPYGYATVGAYNHGPEDNDIGDSETDFGFGFGGGLNWKAGESWGVGLDLAVNSVRVEVAADEKSWDWYLAPRAYLTWNF